MNPSSAPARKTSALKIFLLIAGVFALFGIGLVIAGGWYAKTKVDQAGGLQGFASQMLGKGIELMKPRLDEALQPADRERLAAALTLLKEQSLQLTPEQLQGISEAVKALPAKALDGSFSEADAKAFVDELTRLLSPASLGAPTPPAGETAETGESVGAAASEMDVE